MKEYIILSKGSFIVTTFNDAYHVAIWLLGKDIRHYIIIKNENRIVNLTNSEFSAIKKQLMVA